MEQASEASLRRCWFGVEVYFENVDLENHLVLKAWVSSSLPQDTIQTSVFGARIPSAYSIRLTDFTVRS